MTVVRAAAAALMLSAFALFLAPTVARAGPPEKSAWWYRAKTTTPTNESPQPLPGGDPVVPAIPTGPPTVSADQLHVEGTPAGALAIAAVTYRLAEGESSPVLTLTPATGSVVPPEAVVLACRAAIEWTAPEASPGGWGDRPLADCSTSVPAQVGEGGVLVFALQPLISGTDLDIVIGPGPVAGAPPEADGSSFALTFDRPGPEALSTSAGAAGATDAFDPPPFEEDFGFEPEISSEPEFTLPETSTLDWAAGFGTEGTVGATVGPEDPPPSVPRPAAPALVTGGDVGDAARMLALVVLLLGAIAAYMASSDQPTDVMGLGRFRRARHLPAVGSEAGGELGGLGRLRRARTGRPPAL